MSCAHYNDNPFYLFCIQKVNGPTNDFPPFTVSAPPFLTTCNIIFNTLAVAALSVLCTHANTLSPKVHVVSPNWANYNGNLALICHESKVWVRAELVYSL